MSLNRFLVEELNQVAIQTAEPLVHTDLDFAIGTLMDKELVDAALNSFASVDYELWV